MYVGVGRCVCRALQLTCTDLNYFTYVKDVTQEASSDSR
jgi:hypothetical protein